MKRLLLPLDGSSAAERVLEPAFRIARKFRAEIILVHLLEKKAPQSIHGEDHLRDAAAAEAYLQGLKTQDRFKDVQVSIHVHNEGVDDLAEGIVSHTAELGSDLVLLTVHGISTLTGRFHGNIAQHTLFQGSGPVLFFKEKKGAGAEDFKKILVPLDGDPDHEVVLPLAREWALAYGAEVHLLRVLGTSLTLKEQRRLSARLLPSASAAMTEMESRESLDYLNEVSLPLRKEGISVKIGVPKGGVASKIKRYVEDEGIDLLMLGSHTNFGTRAFWKESVGPKLINRLSVPMLIYPRHTENS